MFRDIWTPVVGEQLACSKVTNNAVDRYAVAVVRQEPRISTGDGGD